MKYIYTILVLFFLINVSLSAQVNTEKFRSFDKSEGFSGAAEIEGSFKSGNAEEQLLSIETLLNYSFTKSKLLLVLNGEYNLTGEEEFSNEALLHSRYVHSLGERVYGELFFQINFDRVRFINFREVAGVNVRYKIYGDSVYTLYSAAGIMEEYERLSESVKSVTLSSTIARSNFYVTSSASFSNIKFSLVTYFQPAVTELNNHRWLVEFSSVFGVNKILSFGINTVYRYDNDPPVEVLKRDLSIKAGLILEI